MRASCASFLLFITVAVASAAELNVKVIDPQSAAVAGAQVSLLQSGGTNILGTQNTSAEGLAVLRTSGPGPYRIKVLAPGFAAEFADAPSHGDDITVRLRLAVTSETVVVSATRNPMPGEDSGADVET